MVSAVGGGIKGLGRPGVYLFSFKDKEDYVYVGSSIHLANRLVKEYFKSKRKINLAILNFNLTSFKIDIYVLPEILYKGKDKDHVVNFVLFLEQYYILLHNPEFN